MNQTPKINSSQYSEISSKNLWIGELEQWMDSKYLIESCISYSKLYNIIIINRYTYKTSKNNT